MESCQWIDAFTGSFLWGLFIDEGPFTAMEFIIDVTHIPCFETILMAG